MDTRYPGGTLRTRDAIERTAVVVVGTLVEAGSAFPGPPGASHITEARFRIEQSLTPGSGAVGRTVKLSYLQQVFPASIAETPMRVGQRYVLFCAMGEHGLNPLKIVPHSDEAVRVVASAFQSGARHGSGDERIA